MSEQLAAVVRLEVAGLEPWVRRLPRRASVTLGRPVLRARPETVAWVPRTLVTFEPCERGWHAQAGPRSGLELRGRAVDGAALFRPGAEVLLTRGAWTLAWPGLDRACRLEVDVRPVDRLRSDAPYVQDRGRPGGTDAAFAGTLVALRREDLTPRELHLLAVAFEHVLDQEEPPHSITRAAALRLGEDERWVHNFLQRTRQRVNRARHDGAPLGTVEELGRYLVHTAHVVRRDDLDP